MGVFFVVAMDINELRIKLDGFPKVRFKVDTLSQHQGFTKQSVILVPKRKELFEDVPIEIDGKIELNFNFLETTEYFDLGREFFIEFHRIQ